MQKTLFILFALLFSSTLSFADAPYNIWWQKANNFFQQKEYDSASFYYEKVSALHPQDAVVYYNLGNAYYRLNKIGPAVLNYQRALQINPKYKEAQDNLALTEARIGNRIPSGGDIFFIKWWNTITSPQKAGMWAVVSLIIFLAVIIILLTRRFGASIKIPGQAVGVLSFLWIVFMAFAVTAANNKASSNKAVIMQNDAPLLTDPKGKTQALVPEGTTVKLKGTEGSWAEIQLPDGRNGWMQTSLFDKI
ncbi:MAG: tetratricopeptide repeat protein [Flavipsychrobacter sp.]